MFEVLHNSVLKQQVPKNTHIVNANINYIFHFSYIKRIVPLAQTSLCDLKFVY